PLILAVRDRLPKDLFPWAGWGELAVLPPAVQLRPEFAEELRGRLEPARAAIEQARQLADRPRGRVPITYLPNVLETTLPRMDALRPVAILLAMDATWLAHERDGDGALRSCRAALNAATTLADEPMAISQLARVAIWSLAGRAAERALGQTEPSTAEL